MPARWVTALIAVALAATACGGGGGGGDKPSASTSATGSTPTSSGEKFPAVDQPGVTPTEIRVSGVAATTNPTATPYGSSFDGVQAHFDMINSRGGIYGRKLVLVKRRDDQLANNMREIQAVIDQDNAFAVVPAATPLFTGAPLLVKNNIPTFGWNIQKEWEGPPNLFGQVGALCLGGECANITLPWVAQKLGKKRIGVLAYNVPQSFQCLDSIVTSFKRYPSATVVFTDKSLSFGVTDVSASVKKMVDANVDLVTTCMDFNGVLTLKKEMRQQGLDAVQYLPNGYNHDFMDKNGGFFEGSIVYVQEAPLETNPKFAALRDYITWMDKAGYTKTENAEIGWVNAAQFVSGLRDAGPDFTRQRVIDAINRQTAFDAGGLIAPIDWTRQHTVKHPPLACGTFVKVHNSKFEVQFTPPGKPFLCLTNQPATVEATEVTYRE
jgi:ABC-type branched-subunit amino acid transport system substrate-binding protein